MTGRTSGSPRVGRAGFTLIEVIGALLIFSVGVIMVLQITGALSRQIENAAVASIVSAEGEEAIDSLSALPYASVVVDTVQDTLSVRGLQYVRVLKISQFSPLVRKLELSLDPATGPGPDFNAMLYVNDSW